MKFLIALLLLICVSLLCDGQVLETSDILYSHPYKNVLNNRSSIDFRTFNNRNLAITSEQGWLSSGGPGKTTLSIELVDDFSHLDEALDISTSVSVSAKYLGATGEGSISTTFNNYYKTDNRTITIVIKLLTNYGHYGFLDPEIKPEYKKLIDDKKFSEFINQCGTHFVSHTENVVSAIAAIHIRNLDHSSKRKLVVDYKAKVSGKFEGLDAGAESSSNIQYLINKAKNISTISTDFFAIGGGGPPALDELIKNINKNDVSQILSALAKFATSGTKENAAPINYLLTSYSRYGLEFNKSYGYDERFLTAIYARMVELNTSLDRIKIALAKNRPEYFSYYNNLRTDYESQLKLCETLALKCINDKDCSYQLPKLARIYWPEETTTNEQLMFQGVYTSVYNKGAGTPSGKILSAGTVRSAGELLFPNYFNRIEFYRSNENNELELIPNFVAGNRISLDPQSHSFGNIDAVGYLAQVFTTRVQFPSYDGERLLNNQANLSIANELKDFLEKQEFYLKTFTTDGEENFIYLGRLNLSGHLTSIANDAE